MNHKDRDLVIQQIHNLQQPSRAGSTTHDKLICSASPCPIASNYPFTIFTVNAMQGDLGEVPVDPTEVEPDE